MNRVDTEKFFEVMAGLQEEIAMLRVDLDSLVKAHACERCMGEGEIRIEDENDVSKPIEYEKCALCKGTGFKI